MTQESSSQGAVRKRPRLSRRRFLAGSAFGASTGLAGCVDSFGGGDDTVKIGFPVALSGPFSFIGESIINGFKLYVDEELGGEIDGREVEYVQQDTEADSATGASVTRELIESKNVDFLVGPVSGGVAVAMFDIVDGSDVVWINPNGANTDFVTNCLPNYFLTCYHHYQLAEATASWVLDNLGETAVLSYANYTSGQSYSSSFEKGYTEVGGEIVGRVEPPLGTEDYSTYLQQIDDMDADLVWSFFAGGDAINYINSFHEFRLDEDKVQVGTGFLLSTDVLPAQGEAAVGKFSSLNYTPSRDIPKNNEFRSSYSDTYDSGPNVYACQGYDTGQLVDHSVTENGGTDVKGVTDAIEGTEIDSPRGYMRIHEEGHYPVQDIHIREVKMGDDGVPYNEIVSTIDRVEHPGPLCTN
jgi:branched-chain amino acid transport system substrate-binding protein